MSKQFAVNRSPIFMPMSMLGGSWTAEYRSGMRFEIVGDVMLGQPFHIRNPITGDLLKCSLDEPWDIETDFG